jgi:hypothetical protein
MMQVTIFKSEPERTIEGTPADILPELRGTSVVVQDTDGEMWHGQLTIKKGEYTLNRLWKGNVTFTPDDVADIGNLGDLPLITLAPPVVIVNGDTHKIPGTPDRPELRGTETGVSPHDDAVKVAKQYGVSVIRDVLVTHIEAAQ